MPTPSSSWLTRTAGSWVHQRAARPRVQRVPQPSRTGMFGFLETEDDPEVFLAMLATAEAWLRRQGCDHMIGPMDFTMNDESGIVIEGHDREPMIRQPWHPPYYQRTLRGRGPGEGGRPPDVGARDRRPAVRAPRDLHDGRARARALRADAAAHDPPVAAQRPGPLRRGLQRRLGDNWGFVPYSKEDLDAYALDLQLVFDPSGSRSSRPPTATSLGVAMSPLDVNQVLQKMNGACCPSAGSTTSTARP